MKKLKYCPLNLSYIDFLYSLWSDGSVIKFTNIPESINLEQVKERISRLEQSDVFIVMNGDVCIGIAGCPCIDRENRRFGIFYQFMSSYWGQGCASEAVGWLLDFMKDRYISAEIIADVINDNIASDKILKKFGFELLSERELQFKSNMTLIKEYRLLL